MPYALPEKRGRVNIEDKIFIASALLQPKTVELDACDFVDTIIRARPGDVIYSDSPYDEASQQMYIGAPFLREDHERLADILQLKVQKGVHVVVSAADTDFMRELYTGFYNHPSSRSNAINQNPDDRADRVDLLLTSFEVKPK